MELLNIIINIVWIILLEINWLSLRLRLDPAVPMLQKEFRKQGSLALFGCFLRHLTFSELERKAVSFLPGFPLAFSWNRLLWFHFACEISSKDTCDLWQYPFAYENSNYTVTLFLLFIHQKHRRYVLGVNTDANRLPTDFLKNVNM